MYTSIFSVFLSTSVIYHSIFSVSRGKKIFVQKRKTAIAFGSAKTKITSNFYVPGQA